jgi:hypothetical protein
VTSTTTDNSAAYRRIVRRETHSPRSGFAILLAVLVLLVAAWLVTETVLVLVGAPPLLSTPGALVDGALALPTAVLPAALVTAGIVVAALGLVCVLVAVLPGRRPRHQGPTGRTALVVDDRAIASALARRAARAAGIDPDNVVVTVGRRAAEVRLSRSSGWAIDTEAVEAAVAHELKRLDLSPALRPTVAVETTGVVGA